MTSTAPSIPRLDDAQCLHGIDRLVVSGRRVFGWGWAAHRARRVKSVHLRVAGESWEHRLRARFGLAREDVERTLPDVAGAGASGFVVTGLLPQPSARMLVLEIELDDGTFGAVDVSSHALDQSAARGKNRVGWLARAVWRRLKRGDVAGIVSRARAQHYGAPSLDDARLLDRLLDELRLCGEICIVFDHNLGGGANHYRHLVVRERLARGQTVLVCTYNMPILRYRLHLMGPGEARVFAISSFVMLDRILDEANVTELLVNSPVSFDEPLLLAAWLARMRHDHPKVRLTVTAHDYFAVCPSFVLLNADGRYCGIPEPAECDKCLERHDASYVGLSPSTRIGPWRALWGLCLEAADEVRCFSESTRRHLRRAYPKLAPDRITVVPHRLDYVPARQPRIDASAPLVVGIVGEITPQKGALIVQDLMTQIDKGHANIRIVVVGSLDIAHNSRRLTVTGKYRREELVDLIESHGINMAFFPSVWPETFSYVVAELIALGLPIVAFDLGAPAERLASYPRGRLCREVSAAAALATLRQFHAELAGEAMAAVAD